jgi:hypothetical protein
VNEIKILEAITRLSGQSNTRVVMTHFQPQPNEAKGFPSHSMIRPDVIIIHECRQLVERLSFCGAGVCIFSNLRIHTHTRTHTLSLLDCDKVLETNVVLETHTASGGVAWVPVTAHLSDVGWRFCLGRPTNE